MVASDRDASGGVMRRSSPSHYEVCRNDSKTNRVLGPFAVLDTAIEEARKLTERKPSEGGLMIVFVDNDQTPAVRVVRAFAALGRSEWADACGNCDGRGGHDVANYSPFGGPTHYFATCPRCNGIGAVRESERRTLMVPGRIHSFLATVKIRKS